MMNNDSEGLTFSSLDPSQRNTFDSILNGDDNLHVVHGPPGTGKSQLVVSLLEGLVSRGKKVLFVSQNTEALKVIERMVLKTQKDIGYPSDAKYLSLLDFCLMLYEPRHRQLKYLREQHSRLSGKQLPDVGAATAPFNTSLNLRYVNLDHTANYSIEGDEVGFDELVGYFIKYVNQAIAPEPLREMGSVNVRGAFKALDDYAQREYFHEYNNPKRELVLLSSKKTDIMLPGIRRSLQDIKAAIGGDWTNFFATETDVDILDYLNFLKEYSSLEKYFDVYKLSTGGVSIDDMKVAFKDLADKSDRIDRKITELDDKSTKATAAAPLDVYGVTDVMDSVTIGDATMAIAQEDIEEAVADKDRIVELISGLVAKYPDIEYASVYDVWLGFGQVVAAAYVQVMNDIKVAINNKVAAERLDGISGLTRTELEAINQEISNFSEKIQNMGAIKRMIVSVPDTLKKHFGIVLVGDFDKIKNTLFPILSLLPRLIGDDEKIGDVVELDDTESVPLRKLKISLPSTTEGVVAELAPLRELVRLLEKHGVTNKDYAQMKREVITLHKSLVSLSLVANEPRNKRLFVSSPLKDIIETTNIAIEAAGYIRDKSQFKIERRELWNEAYNTYRALIVGVESTDDFEAKVPEIYTYLGHKSDKIPKLLHAITIPDYNMPLDVDFDAIVAVLQTVNGTDNFSDDFFEIRTGGTVRKWLDNIAILETYNNDNEVIEFARHNKSIGDIKNMLGAANVRYVDDILSNNVSFDAFSARIVNALVGEVFGRASVNQRAHISTADLLRLYEKYLKSQRAAAYRNTLRELHKGSESATKELSKQTTLQASGKSTMEKFRYNTKNIIEAFPVVCATPKDIAKYIAPSKAIFDYVIFDEASQLLPGQALPSIYRAQKTVIIGDPHQMPPNLNATFSLVEQSDDDFDDLGESILDLVLKQPQKQHHLKVHYRSRYNKLFEPSRQAIYNGAGVEPIFEAELANGAPIDILDDLGDAIDEFGYDKNFSKVCESVEEYLACDEGADFCVLFTTGSMLQKFRSYIEEVGYKQYKKISDLYDNDKILLSTVTNCQGIEGAYTVLYMHHYSRPGAMWFFKEQAGAYKRLNVSITRQREGLKLLLADPRSHWIAACDQKLNSGTTGPNAELSAKLMRSLLTNAGEQADETYLDRTLGENVTSFDSPLTEQLYDRLVKHYEDRLGRDVKIYSEVGWNLVIPKGDGIDANERNVGFRIDLGIYSPVKKRFVLGIEMDGAMYHSGYEKEHSDYTRQKVLENKGWEIYRVWSTNWLADVDKEFDRLVQKINKAIATDV